MDDRSARELLVACYRAGVAAVDPEAAVAANLGPVAGRVVVLALGKAAPAMARGAARALRRERLEGIVVSNHRAPIPDGLVLMLGDHPVPGAASLRAGQALLDLAGTLTEEDTALVLVSGGGSALIEVPVAGISIDDLAVTNRALLRSGADIVATNVVRRKLSRIKGGGLAAAIAPARIITLLVSDVVGDDPATIASGPTIRSGDAGTAAGDVVASLRIEGDLPAAVREALDTPVLPGAVPDQELRIIAGGAVAAHAAAAAAEQRGFPARVVDTRMTGDAAAVAGEVLARAGFGVSVFAGETTVTVTGDGIGGRNQEAALVAATLLDGASGTWFLAAGTDGIDGMTEAAGAVVDGGTVARASAAGLDPGVALDRNDSGGFFAALGEQLVTGPSGTNVGDLWLVLRA
jgi:glycerate 2-kinase